LCPEDLLLLMLSCTSEGGKVPRHGAFVACLTAAACMVSGYTACGRDANYTLHCYYEVVQVVDLGAGLDCRRATLTGMIDQSYPSF
jgi:hypothetical protein